MPQNKPHILTQHDIIDPARAKALWCVLGRDGPAPEDGAPLAPFFHHIYFWQVSPEPLLGRDGHIRPGRGLIPDTGLPRRMWAGGALTFHAPLIAGRPAVKTSRIKRISHKQGRSGPLAFVSLSHEIHQDEQLVLSEVQDLVYMNDPAPNNPRPSPPQAPENSPHCEKVGFSSTYLFRYSALTMNGHRIHYDIDYCREVERYPGLVVHGPLLAQLLMLKASAELGPLTGFSFRATAPLFHHETANLCREGSRLWVRGPDGRLCMEATATSYTATS